MKRIFLLGKSFWLSLLPAVILALACPPAPAWAVTYRFVRIHQEINPYGCQLPKLNNRGEVAWVREKSGDPADRAVFLYSGGQVNRLSPTDKSSVAPDLNNLGEVAWHNWYYDPGDLNPKYEQCFYTAGQITLMEKGMYCDLAPLVNNRSQVLYPTDGDGLLRTQFWLYDHGTKTPVTDRAHIDQNYALNDLGDVAWVRYMLEPDAVYLNGSVIAPAADGAAYYVIRINNLGQVLYTKNVSFIYDLMLYDGQQNVLIRSNTQSGADGADLNDRGQVAYMVRESNIPHVYLYDQGASIKITPPGCTQSIYPNINNRGQVVMQATTPKGGGLYTQEFWIYEAGGFTQVTRNGELDTGGAQFPQFNDSGQIAWRIGAGEIYLATPVTLPSLPILLLD